jgi:Uma2 family endonuclease
MASPKLSARPITAEEFYQLDDPVEGGKMELVDGEVTVYMPVSRKHGVRAIRVARRLDEFAEREGLGEVGTEIGFILSRSPDTVLAPDVSFTASEQLTDDTEGFVNGAPTLAVEVVSPRELDWQVQEKVSKYLAGGTLRVWLVRAKTRSVTVYRKDGTARIIGPGGMLTSDDAGFSVEGFALAIDELFA